MERLIIYGGSFDPVHNGHLRVARVASFRLNADVAFIPAKAPRWKEVSASDKDRLAMLKIAIKEAGSSSFFISECELKRPGKETYSIDTVREFRKRYPHRELILLIGADQVNKFNLWKDADEIARETRIYYCPRPGVEVDEAIVKQFSMIKFDYEGSGEVSSTDIKKLLTADMPLGVIRYIEKHNLYYMPKIASVMTPHRLAHSLSVAHLALAIAEKNHRHSAQKAYIAGLLHDIAKDMAKEEAEPIMARHFKEYLSYPDWSWHQWVGAYIARKEFGIEDEEILDAITYHCTGKAHMPPLTKIIYSADKMDPERGWKSGPYIKACYHDYYDGFLKILEANKEFLEKEGCVSTPLSEECYELYLV
jgi:nicotinate-nucleotide adenylyltransferase